MQLTDAQKLAIGQVFTQLAADVKKWLDEAHYKAPEIMPEYRQHLWARIGDYVYITIEAVENEEHEILPENSTRKGAM